MSTVTDLTGITVEDFEPLAGSGFTVDSANPAGAPVVLQLVEVQRRPGGALGRDPFSLTFEGPRSTFLPQGTRRLVHERLGELDLFLVPVGMTEAAYQYEAVFG